MTPLIKKKFGNNLVAIAARGSFARGTDEPYSDLELFAFLKKMPQGQKKLPYGKLQKIKDGLSVELIWLTEKTYINEVKEISSSWFAVGSEKLLPIHHKRFVEKLNNYKARNVEKKCVEQAVALWPKLSKSALEVLNVAEKKNRERMALAMYHMHENMLNFLSFINCKPFSSSSKKIKEAKKFKRLPKNFLDLTNLIVHGDFRKNFRIRKLVSSVVDEMNQYLENEGHDTKSIPNPKTRPDTFGFGATTNRLERAVTVWGTIQEATTKTLNAAETKNRLGMATVINDMFFQYMKILSLLNAKRMRFSQILKEAKKLKYRPKAFPQLLAIIENGEYGKFAKIKKTTISVFSELENYFTEKGYHLYHDSTDSND